LLGSGGPGCAIDQVANAFGFVFVPTPVINVYFVALAHWSRVKQSASIKYSYPGAYTRPVLLSFVLRHK